MCGKRFALICLAFSLGLSSLWAQASPSPAAPEQSSTPTLPTAEPATATPSSPSMSPASLPPSFWMTWGELEQGLRLQLVLQGQLEQTQTDSETLTQSESASIESAAANSQAASNALDQTSTAISSATASSATTSAAIDQGIQAAVKTDDALSKAQAHAKALELQVGFLKFGCVSLSIGLAGVGVYELGAHDWTLGPIQFKKIW